jgi:hypothetical protein
MRRAKAANSRMMACAGLAIAAAALVAPPARALDDTSTLTSVMSLFGVGSDEQKEKIVYRDRSKLVLPPSGRGLPDPQSHVGARPESWPVDQEVARRRGGETPAPEAVGRNDNPSDPSQPTRGLSCLLGDSEGRCGAGSDAQAKTRGAGEATARAYLVDPPAAFRQRVAGGKGVPDSEKSSDWWNPGALIGRVFGD